MTTGSRAASRATPGCRTARLRRSGAIVVLTTGLLISGAAAASAPGQTPNGPVALRFHHLHYRVPDPAVAMREAVGRLGGTRVILQGLGVGVRAGREYVLFDRAADESDAPHPADPGTSLADTYFQAVAWLRERGLVTVPAEPPPSALALPRGPDQQGYELDHIAFAADDPAAAIGALDAQPFATSDESARYRLPSGLVLEIVRDTGRPDSHWCPMHLDVRAPGEAKCALCGMDLVPIPPPRLGDYRLDVGVVPRAGGDGLSELRFLVRDPETGEPVSTFVEVHQQLFHLFIVSRDLTEFLHVHPDQQDDGAFVLKQELKSGEYLIVADFLPAGGTSQMVQRALVTPGYTGRLFAEPPSLVPAISEQVLDGVHVRLEVSTDAPLRPTMLRFVISDAATGAPVTDLEPYLGTSGHLLIVNRELTTAIHAHPDGVPSSGPAIVFDPILPEPGLYKLWVQFQRKGRVLTVPFVIEAPQW